MAKAKRIQNFGTIDYKNSGASTLDAGTIVVSGDLVGCVVNPIKASETGALEIDGIWSFPKATGAITLGALVYWDATNSNVTTTASTNKCVGVAVAAAASADTTVDVALNWRV